MSILRENLFATAVGSGNCVDRAHSVEKWRCFALAPIIYSSDDDPALLAAYVQYFDLHGYEIRTAQDGVDALAEYGRWFPAVVILDIQMPRLDGRQVVREIRRLARTPAPLLVAVSGLSSPSDMALSLGAGFDHHFAKPALLPVILAAVASRSRILDPNIAQLQSRR